MSAATFVHCNTAEALQSAAQTHPGWPLVITGHSMGGMYNCTHVLIASVEHHDQQFGQAVLTSICNVPVRDFACGTTLLAPRGQMALGPERLFAAAAPDVYSSGL